MNKYKTKRKSKSYDVEVVLKWVKFSVNDKNEISKISQKQKYKIYAIAIKKVIKYIGMSHKTLIANELISAMNRAEKNCQ